MTGLVIALAAVVLALGFGGYRAVTDGRFRGTHRVRGTEQAGDDRAQAGVEGADAVTAWSHVTSSVGDAVLGERATLVQFSSAFCAPCRAARRTLSDVAAAVPGVVHLEIDAEHHLELVRAVDVLRTPTTLVLDAAGREVTRASGAPTREAVLNALSLAVGD